jgi:hypothetical protein
MMKKYSFILFLFILTGTLTASAQIEDSDGISQEMSGIDNFILNDAVKMYPNPVQDYLSISSNLKITRVQVYSLLGELILDRRSKFSRINLIDLNPGIYMIKIHSNQYSVTKKLIKK